MWNSLLRSIASFTFLTIILSLGTFAATASLFHHSITNGEGSRTWLFSRKSPYDMSISPRSVISTTFFTTSLACFSSLILRCLPSSKRTMGPSISSQGVIAAAFPGSSTFSWLPVATKSSSMIIVAGCMEAAASPDNLDLPYLSLKPPGLFG